MIVTLRAAREIASGARAVMVRVTRNAGRTGIGNDILLFLGAAAAASGEN